MERAETHADEQHAGSHPSATQAFEEAARTARRPTYVLVLFVAGTAPRSMRAISNTRKLCDQYLPGCHDLEIVDIYQQPMLAEEAGILAVPALIKKSPPPEMKFIGDMTNLQRVIDGLGLAPTLSGEAG